MDDTLKPVVTEMRCATTMMPSAAKRPPCPTIQGRRMYMITPRIVRIAGVNTPPKVPEFPRRSGQGTLPGEGEPSPGPGDRPPRGLAIDFVLVK
jgi:hypothetical protein